jgi:hypothetical protein
LFGGARLEPVGQDHKIASFTDDAVDLIRCTAVVSGNGYWHMSRIEIDRIAEEHNLDRRNKQDQRDGRSIMDEMQDFDAGHGQHTGDAAPANRNGHSPLREHRVEDASTASSSRIATRATPASLTLATRRRHSSAAESATTRKPGP